MGSNIFIDMCTHTHNPTHPNHHHHQYHQILTFVERRMSQIAPNVCGLVGSKIASQLMGLAGGLVALSRIPANHIQVRGEWVASGLGWDVEGKEGERERRPT